MLDDDTSSEHLLAFCYRHGHDCPVYPSNAAPNYKRTRCNVSGLTCVDWSSMGQNAGWLGDSIFAFCQWARERHSSLEDIVICECVAPFDDHELKVILGAQYSWQTIVVCPTSLGLPVRRTRKYMVGLLRTSRQWHHRVLANGIEKTFFDIFERRPVLQGHALLRAPDSVVKSFIRDLAAKRSLPSRSSKGRSWSCWMALPRGTRRRIQGYEDLALATGKYAHKRDAPFMVDSKDNASFINPNFAFNAGFVPALLRGSQIWSMHKQRLMLPEEGLEVQGHDLFGPVSPFSCPFRDNIVCHNGRVLRQMSGNGMHLACVQSIINFVMATTVDIRI